MHRDARAGRAPARAATILFAGLALVAALAVGSFAVLGAGARGAPPEELDKTELLRRISAAPKNAPDFRATVAVEQKLVPEGLISASSGDGSGASGPSTARIWYGGPQKLRAELQGENGDRVFVRNGPEVRSYDGATNTLETGEKPAAPLPEAASPEEIDKGLAKLSPTSIIETGPPVRTTGRWAYPLTLEPRDKGATLVDRAEALVDAETFVPLSFELYAKGSPEPVARYEARDFEVGPVPEKHFGLAAPPGAKVVPANPGERGDRGEDRGGHDGPRTAGSVAEARRLAGFPARGLAEPVGGRKLKDIRTANGAAVLTYGEGWGTVVLAERADRSGDAGPQGDGRGGTDRERVQVPRVDLGGGVEARELSTPIGSTLSWNAGGVSYSLSGSVPAAELREAARGLLAR